MTSAVEAMFGLAGRTGLVTGAGTGIARVVAACLARAGARLVVSDAEAELADGIAAEIRGQGGDAVAIPADVSDEASVEQLFSAAGDNLDFVVHGATLIGGRTLTELSLAQWEAMQAINMRGAFLVSRAAVRAFQRQSRGGRLIAIGTVGSMHPVITGNTAYAATKAGLNALIRNIAFDHARDEIRANVMIVGPMPNAAPRIFDRVQGEGPGLNQKDRWLLGSGSPEDVGALAVFLAGPSSGHITGQSLVIDGGYLIS